MSSELTKQLLDLCRKWHKRAAIARKSAREASRNIDLSCLKEQFAISDSMDDCANDLSDLVYQIIQSQSTQPTDTHS